MRQVRLHDTKSGEVRPLHPRERGRVGIYACGPTVYSRIHIGNARPFVVFSLLKRFLIHEGYEVRLVVNVTDVNDKIYVAARGKGLDSAELARQMTLAYFRDTDALRLGRPDDEPLASEAMEEIVAYIETLIERGHAYESGGDVYFSVRSDRDYGSLSHRSIEDMGQGDDDSDAGPPDADSPDAHLTDAEPRDVHTPDARPPDVHTPDAHPSSDRKRDPLDFALWKARKPGEDTSWRSPWGAGRPGWHIECSAMAESLLGVGFDIHGGGSDLVFPHHENEAAQTRAARGAELASIWMHNGMIQSTGEKMAKSVGNIRLLHEVIESVAAGRPQDWEGHPAATVVMFLISGHYRQPLAFSQSELDDAELRVLRIREAIGRLRPGGESPTEMRSHVETFFDALAEDFNTPKALSSLFEWVREANRRGEGVGDHDLREMLEAIGLGEMPAVGHAEAASIDPEAHTLALQRQQARAQRDFAAADSLREQIRQRGWEVRDGPEGPELIPLAGD